jgi:drug/metabolite transporter superfamily protein YnfA
MATALSLMVLTALALVGGAVFLWRRGGARRQAILMLVLAAVMAINVAIWAVPDRGGRTLAAPSGLSAAPQ